MITIPALRVKISKATHSFNERVAKRDGVHLYDIRDDIKDGKLKALGEKPVTFNFHFSPVVEEYTINVVI